MPHAVLKTSISFGLVNIPVKVYTSTEHAGVEFTLLCDKCGRPLHYKRWCEHCKREVVWEKVRKGFEVARDKYVPLSHKELERMGLKTTKTIDVVKFVEGTQIDPIYFGYSYYLVPEEGAERAYSLFKEILAVTGKAAIGKVVMRNKEHLVVIRSYKKGLTMTDLHFKAELRDINKLEELQHLVVIKDEELKLARALVSKLEGEFRPGQFKDHYKEAVLELVKKKAKGEILKIKEEYLEIKPTKDLMGALKASVKAKKKKK